MALIEMNNMPSVPVPKDMVRFVDDAEDERNEAARQLAESMLASGNEAGLVWLNEIQLMHEQSLAAEERLQQMMEEEARAKHE